MPRISQLVRLTFPCEVSDVQVTLLSVLSQQKKQCFAQIEFFCDYIFQVNSSCMSDKVQIYFFVLRVWIQILTCLHHENLRVSIVMESNWNKLAAQCN